MMKDLKQTQRSCFRVLQDISGFMNLKNALGCNVQYFARGKKYTLESETFQEVAQLCVMWAVIKQV